MRAYPNLDLLESMGIQRMSLQITDLVQRQPALYSLFVTTGGRPRFAGIAATLLVGAR